MLATHNPKLTNPRAQQKPICSHIIDTLPSYYITSQSVKMQNQFWACPKNAADISKFGDATPASHLPNIQDGQNIKQVIIPTQDNYLCVTPLDSMGLLHEMYTRLQNDDIQHKRHLLESVTAAWSNHGEMLLKQKGRVYILTRGLAKINHNNESDTVVCVRFSAQSVNASSGLVSYGHPAITAVGGLVHAIERQCGQSIKFALGLSDIDHKKAPRQSFYNKSKRAAVWQLSYELLANMQVVLLLKSDNLGALYQHLLERPIHRFAGGSVWEYQVQITDTPPNLNYIVDRKEKVKGGDALNGALVLYDASPATHAINQVGYALLSEPRKQQMARDDYPHAWAEPIYAITNQESFSKSAWWSRKFEDNHIVWSRDKKAH